MVISDLEHLETTSHPDIQSIQGGAAVSANAGAGAFGNIALALTVTTAFAISVRTYAPYPSKKY